MMCMTDAAEAREASRRERDRAERARPRGHGTIYEEGGKLRAKILLPDGEGGRKQYKKRVDTVREGHAYLDDLIERYHGSGHLPAREAENPTVAEWGATFLELKKPEVSPKTYDAYEVAVRRWIVPALGTVKVKNVRGAEVTRLLNYLRDTPGARRMTGEDPTLLSLASQEVQFRVFKTMMREAKRRSILSTLPPMTKEFAPAPTRSRRVGVTDVRSRVIRADWLAYVLATLGDDHYACTVENHRARRCSALWWLRITIGCRQGEVLALAMDDWKPDTRHGSGTGVLHFHTHLERDSFRHGCEEVDGAPSCGRKIGRDCPERVGEGLKRVPGFKSDGAGDRKVTLPESLTTRMQKHVEATYEQAREDRNRLDRKTAYLFGKDGGPEPLSWEQDRTEWLRLWDHAGLTLSTAPRVHDIRHTAASVAVNSQGVPVRHVQKMLGHSDLATTERYIHDDDTASEVADRMNTYWEALAETAPARSEIDIDAAVAAVNPYEEEPERLALGADDSSPFDDD